MTPEKHIQEKHIQAFFCECGTETMVMMNDDDGSITLAMFEFRNAWRSDWQTRLRHIWHIIRNGYPYTDDLVLNNENARALGKKLLEWTTEPPT